MIVAALARTYNHPSYEDPYEAVRDYNRVVEATANNPNKGSTALSTIVELPRGRIRAWVDEDGMPDAARGVMLAQRHGWVDPDGDMSVALAALAGHLLGGGSIAAKNYVPSVAAGRRVSLDELEEVFRDVGVHPTRRHEEFESRATEVLPATHGSVLGRTLAAWGCPVGGRATVETLPTIVDHAGEAGQAGFLDAYVRHRAVDYPNKATSRLHGQQPIAFHQAIADLIEQVTNEHASAGDRGVTVSAAAMRALNLAEP
ncbi:hypothetical protein [Halorubrum sp. Ea8]|uniref:hypothetical protein n=1 Tax=Halorubrum sp. Ea8 TaxID=1383841 RepID=UPI0011405C63|nr:hypothetical protein [Halorubrum sp. Ea8]